MTGQRLVTIFLGCLLPGSVSFSQVQWEEGDGYRRAALVVPERGRTGFQRMDGAETGILFTNRLSQDRFTTNQIFLNGSGVALGDVNGDGWCDIYFAGLDNPNVLYANRGNWRFEDVTQAAGVACDGLASSGVVFADLDGDGDLDLLVNAVGVGTVSFFNDGTGRFEERRQRGLITRRGATSMALADVDGNGALDLYVANYRIETLRDQPRTNFRVNRVGGELRIVAVNGRPVSAPDLRGRFSLTPDGRIVEHGEPDGLFKNDGHGNFTPVRFTEAFRDGEGEPLSSELYEWGLSVMFRDITGNGWPDLYVCNDFDSLDRIWINNGRGEFRPIPSLALRVTPKFSMGVDFADINRNGYEDIFVLDMMSLDHRIRMTRAMTVLDHPEPGRVEHRMQDMRNTLQLNRGDGTYAEAGWFSGLAASEWSWGAVFLDVDLNGYEDLLITTGHGRDDMHMDYALRLEGLRADPRLSPRAYLDERRSTPAMESPNIAFRNNGDATFEEAGSDWGFDSTQISHGMALGDLDQDGDLDVVVNCLNAQALVYRNETIAPRIAVRLKGLGGNTRGIGSRIRVHGGAVPRQSQEVISGGRYLSGDDPVRVFAAGNVTNEMEIEVLWRGGKRTLLRGARPNGIYEIDEPGDEE